MSPPASPARGGPTGPVWRYFGTREVRLARRWAAQGGIAVHENLFKSRGRRTAHLLAGDEPALLHAARSVGCRDAWIQRSRTIHFDLVGPALARALRRCGVDPASPPVQRACEARGPRTSPLRRMEPGVGMQVVLRSHHEKETRLGVAVSVVLHAAPVVVALLAGGVVLQSESLADRFVTYFVPTNKVGSLRSPERRMAYGQTVDQEREGPSAQRSTDQPTAQPAQPEEPAESSTGGGQLAMPEPEPDPEPVWTELEVDSTVLRHPLSTAPSYPKHLLEGRIEGTVYVAFVVDSTGLALPATFRVIRSSHQGFAEAVRDALPMMRFRPAYLGGRPVRQLVEQPFTFRIRTGADTSAPRSSRPPS